MQWFSLISADVRPTQDLLYFRLTCFLYISTETVSNNVVLATDILEGESKSCQLGYATVFCSIQFHCGHYICQRIVVCFHGEGGIHVSFEVFGHTLLQCIKFKFAGMVVSLQTF